MGECCPGLEADKVSIVLFKEEQTLNGQQSQFTHLSNGGDVHSASCMVMEIPGIWKQVVFRGSHQV